MNLLVEAVKHKLFGYRKTGLIPQESDDRDYIFNKTSYNILDRVDWSDSFPPVTDQWVYNSCTAHAVGEMLDHTLRTFKTVRWDIVSSKAYLWYYSRLREGTEKENSGVVLRDVFKAIKEHGFVPETFWDYDNGYDILPDDKTRIAAQFYILYLKTLPSYHLIPQTEWHIKAQMLKTALSMGYCPVFALPIDTRFRGLKSGDIVVTMINEGRYHAMLLVGFDDTEDVFIVRNSWGTKWGDSGYCKISQKLVGGMSFDTWVLMP